MTEESQNERRIGGVPPGGYGTDKEVPPTSSTSPGVTSASAASMSTYRGQSQVTRRVVHRCTEVEQQAAADVARRLMDLSMRTGFVLCQHNGQRRFASPDPLSSPPPGRGTEVFIARIPRDVYEDELVPLFMRAGPVYEFRLMMDFSGTNRGFGFCRFLTAEAAQKAVKELNNFEIRSRIQLGVVPSMDNRRLYIRGLPKNRSREEVKAELSELTDAISDVIIFPNVADKAKNRGFAFIEYYTHKDAAMARRALNPPGKVQIFDCNVVVDWAESEVEIDPEVMKNVKEVFARNFGIDRTKEQIEDGFTRLAEGVPPERVHKQRDYAFVRFPERSAAERALENALDPAKLRDAFPEDEDLDVEWAKPVSADKQLRQRGVFGSLRCPGGPRGGPRNQKPGLLPQPAFMNPFFPGGFSPIQAFNPPTYCVPPTLLGSPGLSMNAPHHAGPGYLAPPGLNSAYRTWAALEMASNNAGSRLGCGMPSFGQPLMHRNNNNNFRHHGPRRVGPENLAFNKHHPYPGDFSKDRVAGAMPGPHSVAFGSNEGELPANGNGEMGSNGGQQEERSATAAAITEGFSMMSLGGYPGYIQPGGPVRMYPGAQHGYGQLSDADRQPVAELPAADNFAHAGMQAVPAADATSASGDQVYHATNGHSAGSAPVQNFYGIPGNPADWAFAAAAAAYNQYYQHQQQQHMMNPPAQERGFIHPGVAFAGQDFYEVSPGIIPQQPVA